MNEVELEERRRRLQAVPLFSQCSEDTLDRVLELATEFEAAPGHVLVQPNEAGTGLFLLESGSAVVELPRKRVELGPGEFFGELALLNETSLHGARVSAATPVRALAIRREDFVSLLESEPRIAVAMLRVVAARLSGLLRD